MAVLYKTLYEGLAKQNAYMNACDCIYYGYGKQHCNNCGISEKDFEEVWKQALKDLSED